MNKVNFVTGFQPDKPDFDMLQDSLEDGLENVAAAVAGKGIKNGYDITIAGSIASASAGTGFDGLGRILIKTDVITADLGTLARPAAGLYRWVTLALKYKVTEQGQVLDINNQANPAQYLDDVEIEIIDTENDDTAANITKPALTDYQVPLLDIRIDETSAWEDLVTESLRKITLMSISEISDDIAKTAHLPIGLVWMYDGADWVDNETLSGWYACVAANAAQGCPDMVDRFILGKIVAGGGVAGGSNTHTISSAELPVHTHTINHDHPSMYFDVLKMSDAAHQVFAGSYVSVGNGASRANTPTRNTYDTVASRVTINLPSFSGSSGNGAFANSPINTKPAFYSMIYIRKCS